jgi:two-component system sensor histidine kinase/response regulator
MSKILVIEDEEFARENLIDLLDLEGHLVFSAENGYRGVELAQEHLPDLIICDIQMPAMDGYQVLSTLRENPSTSTIPFIFLTAKTSHNDLRAGMSLGADDYLTKPYTLDEVLQAVATRLEKQAMIAGRYEGRMDELRQNVAQMLPHELRTPLTLILGYSSLLFQSDGEMAPLEVKEIAENILHAGERLERLIQKFLLYTELALNAQQSAQKQIADEDLMEIPFSHVENMAQQKALEVNREGDLQMELPDGSLQINSPHLLMMLEELLENAFKFSASGTPVQLACKREKGAYVVTITNQGRGMTPEQIAQAGAYTQFERKRHEQQGQGLGLTIARLATERLGGTFSIESIPHEHTSIHLTLPIG